MKQEHKELLLKDLCGRLPYGVVIQEKCLEHDKMFLPNEENNRLMNIDIYDVTLMTNGGSFYHIDEVKPYLFPMSSMTEEQQIDLTKFIANGISGENIVYDWYNKNHFDYRGLIEKGLAIDAKNKKIY